MPASYKIAAARGLVFTTGSGVLTDDDCYGHVSALSTDPLFNPSMDQLADLTQVTEVRLTASAIHRMAERNPFGEGSRRAFVVSDDVAFGMARMYEILTSDHAHDVTVFHDLAKARAWLGL